jgi:Effector-associated domain 1
VREGLNAELFSEFDEALRDAFEYADLKRLVNSLPGRNFEEVVTVGGANLKHIASDLLGNARRQGWLADLAKAAFEQSPENPKLKQFWTKYQSRLRQSRASNKGSEDRRRLDEKVGILEPGEVAALVDRVEQKGDVKIGIRGLEMPRNKPMIFIVKGPVEQLLDLFQTALAIDTIPAVLQPEDDEDSGNARERIVFNTAEWSPRAHNISHDNWRRRLAIEAASALGGLTKDNFEKLIQERLDHNLVDERSFLGIQYDLSSRDLNGLDDFCQFWKQFTVRNGIFLVLLKILKSPHFDWGFWHTWSLWRSISKEPSAKHLKDLPNVLPADVATWWNRNRRKIQDCSTQTDDPLENLFVTKYEERDGLTMKEFRNRFLRLTDRQSMH